MPIQVLDDQLINQIAAGEVVERPAHLVKELLENAVDAGATEVQVDFASGGRYVRITDNGCGIPKDELALALQRHATSKIRKSEDLWKLSSFGFRGEALASMASVSHLEIWSGQKGETAHRLTSEFGRLSDLKPASEILGTQIVVDRLFENVPARLKFLKSATAETTQIKNVLKAAAICNQQVSFRIRSEEKLLYYWPATATLKERVSQVLELPTDELYDYQASEQGYTCQLILLPPHKVAHTTRQILTFVRNRPVQDRTLQQAVIEAYRGALMHGEFPIAVVQLDCPPEEVDVNVHPTKTLVKFRNSQLPFRVIYKAARNFIQNAPWVEGISRPSSQPELFQRPQSTQQSHSRLQPQSPSQSQANTSSVQMTFSAATQPTVAEHSTPFSFPSSEIPTQIPIQTQTQTHSQAQSLSSHQQLWSRVKVLGQAHLTYLLCESENGVLLVDQHAAHERVLFERLMQSWKAGKKLDVQQLLLPLTVDLTEEQTEALQSQMTELLNLGVELEVLGPQAVAISAYPSILSDSAVGKAIIRTAEEILNWGASFSFEKAVHDIFATMACHSAVRAGQSLSMDQMQTLLQQMDEYKESSFCPHGRPVFVELAVTEVERRFGRIN